MFNWVKNIFDSNEKQLKHLQPIIDRVNALESEYQNLSDEVLKSKTQEFKELIHTGTTLDDLLPEAYAAIRESAKRTIGQRHYDVQIIGGIVLHHAKIAEMKTGEGKTLVATLPLYLNALAGQGCHLVTVNDYLAKRDCQWMGPIYDALGLSVACVSARQGQESTNPSPSFLYDANYEAESERWRHLKPVTRQEAYNADITYGTNNEFGFDYLRDNMVNDLSQCVHRQLHYAIVDEVDNILIDEARTPLIISGVAEEATEKYYTFARLVTHLKEEEDYTIDERVRAVSMTEEGIIKAEESLKKTGFMKSSNLYDPANYLLTKYLDGALKAKVLFKKDRDYVVKNGQVIIVDEFTGRLMFGRRYSEGLHQAIEAKEGVRIQKESVTLATVTFQNYFRQYGKLAGMTGTAMTEAEEFYKIYNLEVVVIPTNKPLNRFEHPDTIYRTEKVKFDAVVKEISQLHEQKTPVLIGTTSIEKSEIISRLLTVSGIQHNVLNAKNHEHEASIIAQAGRLSSVTVATNMAGRGVDIILGGSPDNRDETEWLAEHEQVISLGGLHVIGTEHHEARRIDNQLRGRSGRQGDPGYSHFYSSLQDEVVQRFGGDRVDVLMSRFGIEDEVPIEHSLVSKAISNAQIQTETYHFNMRKNLVEYDDVINKHREVIYGERLKVLQSTSLKNNILDMVNREIENIVDNAVENVTGEWDEKELLQEINTILPVKESLVKQNNHQELVQELTNYAASFYEEREMELGAENMRVAERLVMLRVIDRLWMEHLTAMDHMRLGIGLRAVGQQKPLDVYKREGHIYFDTLLAGIQHDVSASIFHIGLKREKPPKKTPVFTGKKVGRNDPCPCGSGKKYKHCCGK